MFALLGALLPLPAIVPILLYIGLLIGAQAFQEVPKAHASAVVDGDHPEHRGVGDRADGQRAGRGRDHRGAGRRRRRWPTPGVVYHGTALLGGGAILAGLVLGAIVAFIIDKKLPGRGRVLRSVGRDARRSSA